MACYNVRDCWMVEELRKEREASQLDIEEITNFISGNEALTARRREICELRRRNTQYSIPKSFEKYSAHSIRK
jgi:hypothetical protein